MRFLILFCLCISISAFDFDIDNVSPSNDVEIPEVFEEKTTTTTTTKTTATTATQAPQEPLGREVPSFAKETKSGPIELNNTTTTTVTTTATATTSTPKMVEVVEEEAQREDTFEEQQLGDSTSKLTLSKKGEVKLEVIVTQSMYRLIDEAMRDRLITFEARIASLLHERENIKKEIDDFTPKTDDDFFSESFKVKDRYIKFNFIYILCIFKFKIHFVDFMFKYILSFCDKI